MVSHSLYHLLLLEICSSKMFVFSPWLLCSMLTIGGSWPREWREEAEEDPHWHHHSIDENGRMTYTRHTWRLMNSNQVQPWWPAKVMLCLSSARFWWFRHRNSSNDQRWTGESDKVKSFPTVSQFGPDINQCPLWLCPCQGLFLLFYTLPVL